MTIQTNLKNIARLGLVIAVTSLSFATITPTQVTLAESIEQRSVSPDVINQGMNGTWNLQWKVNGWLHKGNLKMDGNFGTMIVNVTGPNGKKVYAQQKINMVPNRNGYILKGSRPTYPGTNARNPNYQPDTFQVKSDYRGNWQMKNCSDYHGCLPVRMRKVF